MALPPAAPPPVEEPEPPGLEIVWEDEHLLVVDKPAGRGRPSRCRALDGTLAGALRGRGAMGGPEEPCGIVHRLDRDTSGLLVVARSEEAFSRLQNLVRRREIEREYLALVRAARVRAGAGSRRRSVATVTTRRGTRSTRPRHATLSPTSRWSNCFPSMRCCGCGWKRVARTRSASTWRRSGCRCWETVRTASPDSALTGSSSTRAAWRFRTRSRGSGSTCPPTFRRSWQRRFR